jgi:hypothetical protein
VGSSSLQPTTAKTASNATPKIVALRSYVVIAPPSQAFNRRGSHFADTKGCPYEERSSPDTCDIHLVEALDFEDSGRFVLAEPKIHANTLSGVLASGEGASLPLDEIQGSEFRNTNTWKTIGLVYLIASTGIVVGALVSTGGEVAPDFGSE